MSEACNFYRGLSKPSPELSGVDTGFNPADLAAALKSAGSFAKKRRTPSRTALYLGLSNGGPGV